MTRRHHHQQGQQQGFFRPSLLLVVVVLLVCSNSLVTAEDPYLFFTWKVTYGVISPLGVPQQGILINNLFPGPTIEAVTNNNIVVNVFNQLDEPLLITWNGIQQRKSSWQDGVLGTNCPIPPNTNWTYQFQVKDQIGTFSYFPSIGMQRASGGFGGFNIEARSIIPVPYITPANAYTLLVGDWYKAGHKALQQKLDSGLPLPLPDGVLINGSPNSFTFSGKRGKQYQLRITNVGIATTINFRIQGHTMTLVEVEGSNTLQEVYDQLDIHVGQSMTVLVTLNGNTKDYYIVASTRFTRPALTATAILHYAGSNTGPSLPLPSAMIYQLHGSMKQARTIRLNLTANAARPNPQGSFHYSTIAITKTVILANSATKINGKLRYAVNEISYINPATPLKLADYFNIPGVFSLNTFRDRPLGGPAVFGTPVIGTTLHDFYEIIFQNYETTMQSWHLDGYSFFVVGYGGGQWSPELRGRYNLQDGIYRHTVQVYPKSWTAILVSLDNKGMWNLRSAIWSRRYLGQELYVRVWSDVVSLYTENTIPTNELMCGLAKKP